jgi:hypothetical protein
MILFSEQRICSLSTTELMFGAVFAEVLPGMCWKFQNKCNRNGRKLLNLLPNKLPTLTLYMAMKLN